MKRKKEVFFDTLKKSRGTIIALCLSFICCAVVFFLYSLPFEPFIYVILLIVFFGLSAFIITYIKELSRASSREQMIHSNSTSKSLPTAYTLAEKDYTQAVTLLQNELIKLQDEYENTKQDEIDYYTTWVHQIKTPIAVMKMELGASDTQTNRILDEQLFRIEQYVDMVLTYIRLGSNSTDLVIKEYPLDDLIRETVRKFAPQFVSKRLQLCYDGTDKTIVTDKKWFCCILDQLISNAIKYTQSGSINIFTSNASLDISDTGIGIAQEDLPRIFEKGYTGENGRLDKKSSGLGLYLCKKSADLLQIPLSVKSTIAKGGTFSLDLKGKIQ